MTDRERFLKALQTNVPSIDGKQLVIWGMGNTARLYQEGLRRLEKEGFCISAYCDSRIKEGQAGEQAALFYGKPAISPEKLREMEQVCVLVCTPTPGLIAEIGRELDAMQLEWHLLDEVILKLHADQVIACYDRMADEKSRQVYEDVVMAHIHGKYLQEKADSLADAYFALEPFSAEDAGEAFVDCGAWIGDTVERYIWRRGGMFQKIVAFEPDAGNYAAMQKRLERLNREWNFAEGKITAYPFGVSDTSAAMAFESYQDGLGSKFVGGGKNPSGEGVCQAVALDSFLTEPYSFLKADIESYEYRMLLGAKNGIRKWKPKIAACIYHNAVDLYEIPLLIHEIEKNYQFAVRHHSRTLEETVLYCWI